MSDIDFEQKMRDGLSVTYHRLIAQKQRDNEPIVTSTNGVVQYVDPHSVVL